MNTWDTANIYSNGVSEEIIGKALRKFNIPRHKVVILSKAYAYVGETPAIKTNESDYPLTKDYVNQGGLSRNALFNAVDASLKRLGTDYLDLFQIHRFDNQVPIEETMAALHDLVKSGKVRYIGASSMFAFQVFEFCRMLVENRFTDDETSLRKCNSVQRRMVGQSLSACKTTTRCSTVGSHASNV